MASEKRLQEEVADLSIDLKKKEKDLDIAQKRAAGLSDDEISAQLATEKKLNEQLKVEVKEKTEAMEALGKDGDTLGIAFEELQEQNTRLQQQLKEKDDANFKLINEKSRVDEMLKLLREEKELLGDHSAQLKKHSDGQIVLLRKVEEEKRLVQVCSSPRSC